MLWQYSSLKFAYPADDLTATIDASQKEATAAGAKLAEQATAKLALLEKELQDLLNEKPMGETTVRWPRADAGAGAPGAGPRSFSGLML